MVKLDQDPGPSNVLVGVMPAELPDRDGARFWLVQGPTFIYGARCYGVDIARALVLDRLGYGDRPELAENLSARPATAAEVRHVTARTGRPALVLPRSNRARGRVERIAADLHHHDVRASDSNVSDVGASHYGTVVEPILATSVRRTEAERIG